MRIELVDPRWKPRRDALKEGRHRHIFKSDILNPESENAAVKLALAEARIIDETKAYLESHGILLNSFSTLAGSDPVRRSDTVILVKNIPYGTSAESIREMFEMHGELSRVLIPPAGTIAVVEFVHPDEAARAFKLVAYQLLGSTIVYLEKGPIGMFKEPTSAIVEDVPTTVVTSGAKPITISNEKDVEDEPQTAIVGGTTLFVKIQPLQSLIAPSVVCLPSPSLGFRLNLTRRNPVASSAWVTGSLGSRAPKAQRGP